METRTLEVAEAPDVCDVQGPLAIEGVRARFGLSGRVIM
jgi:hypothetical protein